MTYGFDISEDALGKAADYLGKRDHVRLVPADFNQPDSFGTVQQLIDQHRDTRCVLVCFEVLEHLVDFGPMVAFINQQVNSGLDAFLSVPNDAFFGTQNPFHCTTFGEDSLAELLQLFDSKPQVHKQCPIKGAAIMISAMTQLDEERTTGKVLPKLFERPQTSTVPSHFILSFTSTPISDPPPIVRFHVADLAAERQWTSQRESDLAYYREETKRLTRQWRLAKRILKDLQVHFSDNQIQRTIRKLAMLTKLAE
jgi:hypothetical protein